MEEIDATIPEYGGTTSTGNTIASFMVVVVQPRTMNHPFLPDSLVTQELVPLFNVESFTHFFNQINYFHQHYQISSKLWYVYIQTLRRIWASFGAIYILSTRILYVRLAGTT